MDIMDIMDFFFFRQLGIPHQETVILFNRDHNKTIHLLSISGNTRHFHSSFFRNKVSFFMIQIFM